MFIAMNKFQIVPGQEGEFERRWRERETYLDKVPGFVQFALLKGDNEGEYISHTIWQDRDAFVAWTKSQNFVNGHRQGSTAGVIAGHPVVSLYEAVLVESREKAATR